MTLIEQWNERRDDVQRMFEFEPKGCFIAEVDGELAGHVFSIAYETLGWVGYLIVSSNYRRKGVATILMKKAVDYLVSQKVQTIKLDAVPEIADLYRRLGFVDECSSLRFLGANELPCASQNRTVKPIEREIVAGIAGFDMEYFGADRSRVLKRLIEENPDLSFASYSGSHVIGYITCHKAESGYELGPWVCHPQSPRIAKKLLVACLNRLEPNSKIYVGLPSLNTAAVSVLLAYGFKQYSESVRMRFGKILETEHPDGIFAIAGPMKG
jgi:ribosomal protein S18 acetylase RimI-like enzyme